MASYQVTCSVSRPPEPAALCQVTQFQDKVQQHIGSVFQDLVLTGSGRGSSGQSAQSGTSDGGAGADATLPGGDNLICALVSKTSASFSGADNFQSRVKLPFYWCDLCPFDTECKASLLQHVVSQHCFSCRHCPYVALSRCDVVQHALSQHPEFAQQFRDQRLKGCQLKRHTFQTCFQPQSAPLQSRKRSAPDAHSPPPAKQGRGENNTDNPEMNVEQEEQEGGNSSSSESVDELPLHFTVTGRQGNGSLPSQLRAERGLATHVMALGENVVSSSGMEPDTGGDANLALNGEAAARTPQDQTPTHAMTSDTVTHNQHSEPSTVVKQEPDPGDEGFAHALGRGQGGSEQTGVAQDGQADESQAHHSAVAAVQIKQEPQDSWTEDGDVTTADSESAHHLSQQSASLTRSAANPSLSHIQVENLQQQFEESFGVQTGASGTDPRYPEPHPVQLFAQSHRPISGQVENFLLDTPHQHPLEADSELGVLPEGSDETSSASSVLRNLLTRPRQQADDAEGSPHTSQGDDAVDDDDDCIGSGREDSQSGDTNIHAGHGETADLQASHALGQNTDNFLLMPEDEQNGQTSGPAIAEVFSQADNMNSMGTEQRSFPQSGTPSEGNAPPFIKQEPEDDVEVFSHTDVTAHAPPQPDYNHRDQLRSESIYPMSGSVKDNNQKSSSQQSAADLLSRQQENQVPSPSTHYGQKASASTPTMLAAEKLKSYSNMSLRDILTMNTDLGQSLANRVSEQNPVHRVSEQNPGYSTGENEGAVMWECGFCHFAAHSKSVVMAHRNQQHAQQMAEAGFGEEEMETWARSSMEDEEEWSNQEYQEEEELSIQWRNQPSTSKEYGQALQKYVQKYIPAWQPPAQSKSSQEQGVQAAPTRSSRMRGFKHDDDFEYLSEESVESDSDGEDEDLNDKNYVPPKNLLLQQVISSEDDEDDEEEVETRPRKASVVTHRRRGRPPKNPSKETVDQKHLRKEILEEACDWIKKPETLYHCVFCHHKPASVQVLKNHIRMVNDGKHMLIARRVVLPESLIYICPADVCNNTYSDSGAYVTHVLHCQGQVLDAQEVSIKESSVKALDKVHRVAGFLNCPISNCYYVSYFKDQMQVHLELHVKHVHSSQMLLFSSVCSAMARMYSALERFDGFVCYRCCSTITDLPTVIEHVEAKHGGLVRGVLHIYQKADKKSRGIMVAVQCLKCRCRLPSLNRWFSHYCSPTASELKLRALASSWSGTDTDVALYEPKPCIPGFEEWLWRMQSSAIKVVAQPVSTAKSEMEKAASQGQQLPLIRSILLADPNSSANKGISNSKSRLHSAAHKEQKDSKPKDSEDDDVVPMIACEKCQEVVSETKWKQHKCFINALKAAAESGGDDKAQGSSTGTPLLHSQLSSTSKDVPAQPSHASHASLLSALATRHQSDSATTALTPTPSNSAHPSLISLLTRAPGTSGNQPTKPQSTGAELQSPASTQPERKDMGMIRSLLLRSKSEVQSARDLMAKTPPSAQAVSDSQGAADVTDQPNTQLFDAEKALTVMKTRSGQSMSGNQIPESKTASATVSTRSRQDRSGDGGVGDSSLQQQQPSAASMLQSLADDVSGSGRTSSPGSASGSAQALLMSFLHQQGNQVMQVLGNVLNDQSDKSSS